MESAESLKFEIYCQRNYYLDSAIMLAGSMALPLTIAFIWNKHEIKLHHCIDNYMALLKRDKSDQGFSNLCHILNIWAFLSNRINPPYKVYDLIGYTTRYKNNMSIPQDKI